MKNSVPFWILALLGWCLLGAFLFNLFLCPVFYGGGTTAAATAATTATTAAAAATKAAPAAVKTVPAAAKAAASKFWAIGDKSAFATKSENFISFNNSGFNHLTPQSASLKGALAKTADYLKKNPKRSLLITGYYMKDEKNPSILPNLGLARATDVKEIMKGLGVPASQIALGSELIGKDLFEGKKLVQGVEFGFTEVAKGDTRISDIKKRLFGKPLTVYFGTNQNTINLTSAQRKDISDLIYYLDNVKGSKLGISGHTDNVGNRAYNVNLSKERAAFVQNYMNKNGRISMKSMSVNGFGPDKPIAPNTTADGKAKNRRVEVTLQ